MTNKTLSEQICEECGIEAHEDKYCFWECKNPELIEEQEQQCT